MNPDANVLYYIIGYMVFPFSMMCVVYYEGNKNLNKLVIALLWILGAYMIFGLLFQEGGSGRGEGWDARGGTELGNSLPLNACVLSFVSFFAYVKKYISLKMVICLLLLSLFAILFVSTRKALGGWVILILFFLIGQLNIRKPKNILLFLLLGFATYAIVDYVLANTLIGARMNAIEDAGMKFNYTNIKWLNYFGDRAFFILRVGEFSLKIHIQGLGYVISPK